MRTIGEDHCYLASKLIQTDFFLGDPPDSQFLENGFKSSNQFCVATGGAVCFSVANAS